LSKDLFDTLIVRFGGEIGIKALWTRKQYERRLSNNIKAVLKHFKTPYSVFVKKAGRLYIKTRQAERAAGKISRVFGVSSMSPAIETSSNLKDMLEIGSRLARSRFARKKSFAVCCRRIGNHQYTSQDICALVGERILTSLPEFKLRVDLRHPEQTLEVEVRDEKAYLFTNIIKGVGGLPLGTQPKLVCLLNGDVLSTVACWMTMKRGCPPILVHVEDDAIRRQENINKVKKTSQALMKWNIGFPRRLRATAYHRKLKKSLGKYPSWLRALMRKRLILRIAQQIAEAEHAEGIVTGDFVVEGESTQAVHSFTVQDEAVKGFPIYRPLIGLDEAEIASLAKTIGLTKTMRRTVGRRELEAAAELGIEIAEHELSIEEVVEKSVKSMRQLEV